MKIKFKKSDEQVALIRAMASNDRTVAMEAQEAFAAFVGPVIQQVIQQAGTASMIYKDVEFNEDDGDASYPLDLYYGEKAGYISIWSQEIANGLATNHVSGIKEMKFQTYSLDSAISMSKKYARKARLDVVAAALQRLSQELLVKQERMAWSVLLSVVANAATVVNGTSKNHVFRTGTAGVLQIDDFNKLITLGRRISASFADGTPASDSAFGVTDLFISPEAKEQIRGFAYQPMNTRTGTLTTSGATAVPLPESVREEIYRNAGASEIFGKTLHELNELGEGQKYNQLFRAINTTKQYAQADGTTGAAVFNASTDDLLVGVDLSRESFLRPVATESETGGQVVVLPDDQFVARQGKLGYYAKIEEGRVSLDQRAAFGLIV